MDEVTSGYRKNTGNYHEIPKENIYQFEEYIKEKTQEDVKVKDRKSTYDAIKAI